jgi:hypothetical protein
VDPSEPPPVQWSTTRRAARRAGAVYRAANDRAMLTAAALLEPLLALGPAAAVVVADPLLIGPVLVMLAMVATWSILVRWWHRRTGTAAALNAPEDGTAGDAQPPGCATP